MNVFFLKELLISALFKLNFKSSIQTFLGTMSEKISALCQSELSQCTLYSKSLFIICNVLVPVYANCLPCRQGNTDLWLPTNNLFINGYLFAFAPYINYEALNTKNYQLQIIIERVFKFV